MKNEPYIKIRELHGKLYDMWNKLEPILEKHDIKYFADGGSLLGAYRHSGIIPHDDDMDIGIMIEDEHKLFSNEFRADLEKVHLKFDPSLKILYKIFPTDGLSDIFIDIFVFENKEGKIHFVPEKTRRKWPNNYYHYEELFPLNTYVFGRSTIKGANNPIPVFNRQYGADWMTPINDHNHHDVLFDE
jgi:phosphorylcholine metabolism protein LicD